MTNTLSTLPDPNHFGSIGWFLVVLVAIVMGVNAVLKLIDRFKEKPPANETYQTLAMCRQIHSGVDDRLNKSECAAKEVRAEIRDMEHRLNNSDEQRSVAIHNRINDVEK
jgi:hypothetical protein